MSVRESLLMPRLSPLVALIVGYILGYALYPVLQLWPCTCHVEDADITAHAQSFVAERRFVVTPGFGDDLSLPGRSRRGRSSAWQLDPAIYASSPSLWRQLFNSRRGPPAHLSSEYKVRRRLLIGIITSGKYLMTRAKAIHDTWAKKLGPSNKILFFVGSDCNISHPALEKMSMVFLDNVSDTVYPPQRKVFAALKHMYRYYGNSYQWFVRADDDVYIRVSRLDRLLGRLDPNELIYLGRAGVGRRQDIKRLQLKSNERYCMGGPGVVLSRGTLNKVAPHLMKCLKAVEMHNQGGVAEGAWFNEDVELGRCISRTLNIQCSNSKEVYIYMYMAYGVILHCVVAVNKHNMLITCSCKA